MMSSLGYPAVSTRELRAALERAGFVMRRSHGGHINYVRDGLLVTLPSASSEVRRGALRGIARQIGMTPKQFTAWVKGEGIEP